MNRIRIGLVGLVVLALTGLAAGGASAATGRGTATSSITLLDITLGDVQRLKVLTNDSQGTLDGTAGAFAQLLALDATGAINLALPNPPMRAQAPGTSNAALEPFSLSAPLAGTSASGTNLPVGVGVLATGSIDPLRVDAVLDSAGARSAVGTDIPSLDVLQGLLSVNNAKIAGLTSNASPTSSRGDAGTVSVDEVSVLDLDAFLGGLGLSLDDLSLGAITGLIDTLGLPVPTGALGLGDLDGAGVASILGSIFDLTNAINTVVPNAASCEDLAVLSSLLSPVDSVISTGGLLGGLSIDGLLGTGSVGTLLDACTVDNLDATKTGILGDLQGTLTGLAPTADGVLDSVFSTLGGASLLSVTDVELSAMALAAETLAGSSATTAAKLGTIKVGGLSVGTLDLNATAAQITALVNSVESTLGSVTGVLGLGNLIDIGILERTTSTRTENGYNIAEAGINVLRVAINPPAALSSVLGTAGVLTNPLSGIMGSIGTTLPTAGLADNTLASAFGLPSLLSQPTTIVLGAMLAQGDFTTVAPAGVTGGGPVSPPVAGELPRTGPSNGAWMAALAALSLAGAFGITRSLRRTPAEIDG